MMYQQFIRREGFRNISRGSQITGFQFKIHIPYYRGLWVSQAFQDFAVRVDGVSYPLDNVSVKIGDRVLSWAQINGAYDVFWHYGKPATIIVDKPGGLTMGLHKVECDIHYQRSYWVKPEDYDKGLINKPATPRMIGGSPVEWHKCSMDMVLVI